MITLVIGGASSGKSKFAEAHVLSLGENRIYVATMEPFGSEGARRIKKHREMRAGKGFETVECTNSIARIADSAKNKNLLLEDLPNLVANEVFGVGESTDDEIISSVVDGITALAESASHLTIVTGDLTSDGIIYDDSTERYLRLLGKINAMVARKCDEVIEIAFGQVVTRLKG